MLNHGVYLMPVHRSYNFFLTRLLFYNHFKQIQQNPIATLE